MSIRVLSGLRLSFVFLRLDVYKEGKVISHKTKMLLKKDIFTSKETPLVSIAGKKIMTGYIDESTGNWIYDINLELKGTSVNLRFLGCTKGWMGQHQGGDWWAVVLPRAKVSGKIKVGGKSIDVKGEGYHDHNWDVKIFAMMNFGWYWGKINSENYTITWANVMETKSNGQSLAVINKKDNGYFSIKPENINFSTKNFQPAGRMKIPNSFLIDTKDEEVSFHLDMKSLGKTHHERILFIMNYWRYHLECKGFIVENTKKEIVDNVQIAEFLRFK